MLLLLKKIWFTCHKIGIYITPYLWIYNKNFLFLYWVIIMSWELNHNKCIISEIEYHIFSETFMGRGRKYYVPQMHRLILHLNFFVGALYYLK